MLGYSYKLDLFKIKLCIFINSKVIRKEKKSSNLLDVGDMEVIPKLKFYSKLIFNHTYT